MLFTAAFISAFLISAAAEAQFNVVYATETPADVEEVLVFLRDVVELDMTKYNVIMVTNETNYWPELGGIAQTTGQYRLDSTGFVDSTGECGKSILTVMFTFMDEQFISCSWHEDSQGPAYYSVQPACELSAVALGFLQRYQTCTGDSQLAQMISLLETVDLTSNTTETIGNLELEVSIEDNRTNLTWGNMLNGAAYSRLIFDFEGTELSHFSDDRSFYRLGRSEVNISQQQAESIAIERVDEETPKPILRELTRSYPSFLNRGDFREQFACWIVNVPLNVTDPRPSDVCYFVVMIWADSGEVISCEGLGVDFPWSPDPTATPAPTATPLASPTASPSLTPHPQSEPFPTTLVAIASVILISITGIGLLVYFKKRKH
jgi:hypothetical protein